MTIGSEQHEISVMPPVEEMAARTITRLATEGYASSLMKLSRPTLNELARRLVTPGMGRADVHRWLNESTGTEIDQNTFYRFAQRFSEAYRFVWGEISTQVLMAELAKDPRFDSERVRELSRNKLQMLVAQELVTAHTPGELDTDRLRLILSTVQHFDRAEHDTQKLAIDRDMALHRMRKLEAEIDKARQTLSKLPDKIAALQKRIDDMQRAADQGRRIDPAIFASIRAELVALAPPEAPPEVAPEAAAKEVA